MIVEHRFPKAIDAADGVDLVAVNLFLVGQLDVGIGQRRIDIGVVRIDRRIAHIGEQQEVLVNGFRVAGDAGAHIV